MFQQRFARRTDGTQLAYYIAGSGSRWLVIANGHGATHHVWEDVVQNLGDDFCVVTWDYRGQHNSDAPLDSEAIRIDDHALDWEIVMEAESIESCVLAGWSLGVQVALQSYRRQPKRIIALALIHGAHDQLLHRLFNGRFKPIVRTAVTAAGFVLPRVRPVLVPVLQSLLSTRLGFKPLQVIGFVTQVTPGLRQMAIELTALDMRMYMRTVTVAGEHRSEPWLHEVTVPVAVTGGRGDWLTPETQILRAFERLPNAIYHQFNGTHFPIAEEPKRVADLIRRLADYAGS